MGLMEKEDEKSSAFWDWFIGIGLVVLIGGFTAYYQWQKRLSQTRFRQADSLFQEGRFAEAASAYEALKNASYVTARNDSILYARLDSIQEIREREREVVARLRSRTAAGDTAGARAELDSFRFQGLLGPEDQRWLDSARAAR